MTATTQERPTAAAQLAKAKADLADVEGAVSVAEAELNAAREEAAVEGQTARTARVLAAKKKLAKLQELREEGAASVRAWTRAKEQQQAVDEAAVKRQRREDRERLYAEAEERREAAAEFLRAVLEDLTAHDQALIEIRKEAIAAGVALSTGSRPFSQDGRLLNGIVSGLQLMLRYHDRPEG